MKSQQKLKELIETSNWSKDELEEWIDYVLIQHCDWKFPIDDLNSWFDNHKFSVNKKSIIIQMDILADIYWLSQNIYRDKFGDYFKGIYEVKQKEKENEHRAS